MPLDLLLVRHGESEGNDAARRWYKESDASGYRAMRGRHTAESRLTAQGVQQAQWAGRWLREEFPEPFGRLFVSDYYRALESAGLLGLEGPWHREPSIIECQWGGAIDYIPEEEAAFQTWLKRRAKEVELVKRNPFFYAPPSGESLAMVIYRLRGILDTLHRECSSGRVLAVVHGTVMQALQVILERIPPWEFKRRAHERTQPGSEFPNAAILHYTRKNPEDPGQTAPYLDWMRIIRAHANGAEVSPWRHIHRPKFTGAELLAVVENR